MEKIITATEASKLVSGSDERKTELIKAINAEIKEQAKKGLRWAHIPVKTNQEEDNWLLEELLLAGFTINKLAHPRITW